MCGITGYVGDRDGLPIIAESLKNLEYRGYDSAGVALENGALEVYKQAGEIDALELPATSNARCGVGHTRWSTHGEPTDANAHPHDPRRADRRERPPPHRLHRPHRRRP